MVTDDQKIKIVRYLNDYCFQRVWNSIRSEYRGNFALRPLKARQQTSVIVLKDAVVGLPTTDAYMTFYFSKVLLQGAVKLQEGLWYDLTKIANEYNVKLTVYNAGGYCTPMSKTFVRLSVDGHVLVAIEKQALMKTIPTGISSDFYMTVFRNAQSLTSSFSAWSAQLTTYNQADSLLATARQNVAQTLIWINGVMYDADNLPARAVGDYVDILYDPEIVGEFSVTVDDNSTGYSSTLYSDYREILHCPKALNPNQYICTHDALTLSVKNTVTGKSVYLHRVDPNSVKQITHSDFSVSRDTLNGFKDALGGDNIEVVARLRFHNDPQILMADSSWISDLYLNTDTDIVGHLRGALDATLTFWTAAVLEASGYISLMYNVDDILDPSRLDAYISALGYYAVGAILSANMYRGIYNDADFICTKPFILRDREITPLVYVNGKKLLQSKITTTDFSNQRVGVSISPASVTSGDQIDINIVERGDANPLRFTPSATTPSITVTDPDGYIYQENHLSAPVVGYKRQSEVAYLMVSEGNNTYSVYENSDGTYEVTFTPSQYGNTFLLYPTYFLYHEEISLDPYLSAVDPLIFPLHTLASDSTDVPLLGYTSVGIYINGYRLVENIDYILSPLTTTSGIALVDVVITNMSYFDAANTGNTLEIIAHTGYTATRDYGYAKNNLLIKNSDISVWYSQVGNAFIEGVLTDNLQDYAVYMTPSTNVDNGKVFLLQTTYPRVVSEVLANYTPAQDIATLRAIDKYLGRSVPKIPNILPVYEEHSVYSPYLTAIIRDLIYGDLVLTNDPNDQTFLAQFTPYEYLLERDPTVQASNDIDRNFVKVAACYTQFPQTSPLNMSMIQRLIRLRLVSAGSDLGVTLI